MTIGERIRNFPPWVWMLSLCLSMIAGPLVVWLGLLPAFFATPLLIALVAFNIVGLFESRERKKIDAEFREEHREFYDKT